jgi:hypothetical protein
MKWGKFSILPHIWWCVIDEKTFKLLKKYINNFFPLSSSHNVQEDSTQWNHLVCRTEKNENSKKECASRHSQT